ncbi:zinc/cadmium resistance protein-like protein [Cladochytrium replicatum]|nr:zinc/cadmium resistance protein-like protein [Cladochytrium replicatum]
MKVKLDMGMRERKLLVFGSLTVSFFFVELIVGYVTGSLALVADSFHMLSDVVALIVGFLAIRLARNYSNSTPSYTYGLQRAEVLGALVNGVFLLALCFTIIVQAIERFVTPTPIQDPNLVLIVGAVGLGSNIIGLFLFHDHGGHSHGSHSHGHGHSRGHGQGHKHAESPKGLRKNSSRYSLEDLSSVKFPNSARATIITTAKEIEKRYASGAEEAAGSSSGSPAFKISSSFVVESDVSNPNIDVEEHTISDLEKQKLHRHSHESHDHHDDHDHKSDHQGDHDHRSHAPSHKGSSVSGKTKSPKQRDLNLHGVFLHVAGDALGSVGVIASALIFKYGGEGNWRLYMDPLVSVLIALLLLNATIPLVRSAAVILLQGVPNWIPLDNLRRDILSIPSVMDIHELHVWQLSDTKVIASVHIVLEEPPAGVYMDVLETVKAMFHSFGIHSTVVQPEFVKPRPNSPQVHQDNGITPAEGATDTLLDVQDLQCLLRCVSPACETDACCPPQKPATAGNESNA